MKKIIHVDMDCFFAAVEIRDNPCLKGLPVAVGGPSVTRGVLCAANYEARRYGVHSAMSTVLALRKCPELRLIPPDIQKYVTESRKIQAIFRKFTEVIEPLSLDEAYLDVTDSPYFRGSASLIAEEIRKQIFHTTGLTASAGIAPNKFLAKVASDWNKPNGQFLITPDMVDDFVKNLPVEKIWGVGKVTARKLHILGMKTCGDLQQLSLVQLKKYFGGFGFSLYENCRGIDRREVVTSRDRKSISIERTFNEDVETLDECLALMPGLYERLERRSHGFLSSELTEINSMENPRTLFVKIRFSDFSSTTIESSFDSAKPEYFSILLKKGLERQYKSKYLSVRLIGLGIRLKSSKKQYDPQNREFTHRQLSFAF